MTPVILILAAGASTRMGAPKQLLPFMGSTLLGHVLNAALDAGCGPVMVVVGAHAGDIRQRLPDGPFTIVTNAGWEAGIGSSISAGVEAIERLLPEASHVLVLLADQPRIDAALIRCYVERARQRPAAIIAAGYDGITGVPALFPQAYFGDLKRIHPENGAKPLLARYSAHLDLIAIASNPDIDTPEDYDRLHA